MDRPLQAVKQAQTVLNGALRNSKKFFCPISDRFCPKTDTNHCKELHVSLHKTAQNRATGFKTKKCRKSGNFLEGKFRTFSALVIWRPAR